MSERVEKRKDPRGVDIDVVVVQHDPSPGELAARIAALETALDSIKPGWRKGQ